MRSRYVASHHGRGGARSSRRGGRCCYQRLWSLGGSDSVKCTENIHVHTIHVHRKYDRLFKSSNFLKGVCIEFLKYRFIEKHIPIPIIMNNFKTFVQKIFPIEFEDVLIISPVSNKKYH